ncbi:TPA: hypothetical protein ACPOOB_001082 [Haemophilus influenzae]|uniref:phage integrase central domain-containing protein n=1 Tax=Haemophilus TaxID=724 RepID=UPI001D14DAE6|nr:hypothetical protein [Haemophilus influenzae]MCK8821047.1 hypothetical protein [Haemophilus influenzae]MCK8881143.1 hypothetical protein [Haemophilus influenzae]UEB29150.1 hypothetical protein LK420_08285 [Haemophilus influenzae]
MYKEKAKNSETREKNWERLKNHIFPYIGDKHLSEIKVKELVSICEKIADRSNTLKKNTPDYRCNNGSCDNTRYHGKS